MQQRVATTVIAVVGDGATEAAATLGTAANVRAVLPDAVHPLDRALAAWRTASATHAPYLVHDADPLAVVAAAWAAWFDGVGARGELEVAIAEVTTRWRAGTLELPDYYLAVGADELPTTVRHWYLGVLHAAAPTRVVPAPSEATGLIDTLASLRAGRWWPDLDQLLAGVETVVPDRAGLDDYEPATSGMRVIASRTASSG